MRAHICTISDAHLDKSKSLKFRAHQLASPFTMNHVWKMWGPNFEVGDGPQFMQDGHHFERSEFTKVNSHLYIFGILCVWFCNRSKLHDTAKYFNPTCLHYNIIETCSIIQKCDLNQSLYVRPQSKFVWPPANKLTCPGKR